MVQIVQRASDVRTQEINLSSVLASNSVTVAAIPIVSKQGQTIPVLHTNTTDFLGEYGNPDPAVSMTIQSGLNYLSQGSQIWGLRVVGDQAMYSGVLLKFYDDETGSGMALQPMGIQDPLNTDLETLVTAGESAIAFFYPSHGPGSYGNDLKIGITTVTPAPPMDLEGEAHAVNQWGDPAGTLAVGTYTYSLTTITSLGESLPVEVDVQVTVAGSAIHLVWPNVENAIAYCIYREGTAAIGYLTQVGAYQLGFTDTGSITVDPGLTPPNSSSDVLQSPEFVVSVYDVTNPQAGAIETWTCTLDRNVNSAGVQTELEERINPFSGLIRVVSNAAVFGDNQPDMLPIDPTQMDGGDSGTTPTSSQIALAMQVFVNKQVYNTNVFINGGIADPVYQIEMDKLVQARGDAVNLIDTPASMQKFNFAIDYRNLELNLNSTYSALFNPDLLQADLYNGQQIYIPPSGWAAAQCALTDRIANQAHSIAGLNRGILPVLKQRWTFDDGQATAMYQAQVNYTRTFVGQGIALWEQQTLSGQYSALSWLNVRRLINVIKVASYQYLLYALQEQDTDALRRSIVNGLSSYLDTWVAASGVSAYKVVCDESNNPAAAVNAGILVVTIAIIPVLAVHEIQLQLAISKSGVSFAEVLTQVNGSTV